MRWKHRIPVRIRHYWKFLAGCLAFALVLAVTLSSVPIRPYVTSTSSSGGDLVTQDIAGTVDLFDETVAHRIELVFRDADYERMLDAFYAEGEKEYLEADLVIDGTAIPSVGIRLKGNSTLRSLTRNGQTSQRGGGPDGPEGPGGTDGQRWPGGQNGPRGPGWPGGQAGPGQFGPPGGVQGPPGGAQVPPGGQTAPDGQAGPDGQVGPGGQAGPDGQAGPGGQVAPGGLSRTSLRAEEPETLPWLIRFDEYVEGRRYQGHREIAVRVAGMGGGTTVLNEAVTLNLLAAAGEVAQEYAYTSFTVNDRPTTARLVVEHPDEHFAEDFDTAGVLYKALATSEFADQGDDQTAYADDFKQITMKGSQDLQPVIDLIRWVDTASDAEFDTQLADRLDVTSFARYVAWQNLLLNFDDMSGPGRNYYLWYDLGAKRFTVIGWDHNLTFSGSAEQGPHEQGRLGGGRGNAGGAGPGGAGPGNGGPGGAGPGNGGPGGVGPGNGGPGGAGPGGGGHKLKERFLASEKFTQLYEDTYRDLYQRVYGDGAALAAVDAISGVLATVDGYDASAATGDAQRLRTLIEQRTASLATNEVITRS
ncbi:CotH kinase family protein [Verrucosispora sp. FIM060022]|uniref:CotH kinase family protein n=1 Tax=Verrucosispora sp. FIM060022 TaxID=1479020 RepID=UPI000F883FE3|nr:CotH kinase family protein [Verrucosispora sp. FIM060022]RUL94863.1 spore coat protein CotH [Verrucosispora sp. FIM060022]